LQQLTRTEIEKVDLEQALSMSNSLATKLLAEMKELEILEEMGIEILNITFNSIRPTPEISKALEADYREKLQKKADESIYERRAAAVEQERKIKENELNNQIALEEKKKELIAIQSENQIKKAEINAKVTELELYPYKELEPNQLLSFALKDLSKNANKIGNLTITSEILSQILNKNKSDK
jgi:regulator of protease activity HflC (stomatin/prohibitin superfamily)